MQEASHVHLGFGERPHAQSNIIWATYPDVSINS